MVLSITLDDWQKDVINASGNICLRSGRQVGKSTCIAIKAGQYALKNSKKNIMVISAVERQASLLFEKILNYIMAESPKMIIMGKDRPTKSKIRLKNGSVIYCLPVGESGLGIRGYTIHLLIADEAAFIPEPVWSAVTPMLAVTHGQIILLSTPYGREGYFARCFIDETYTKFHISSEECPRVDKVFLAHEKATMSKMQYAQEYLGEFVDELMQWFSDDLIKRCQMLKRPENVPLKKDYYLGVDVARMGGDETAFCIVERTQNKNLIQAEQILRINNRITETTNEIIELDKKYHFRKIYIDDGGLGVGVFDYLLENEQTRRKVIGINNARRSIEPSTMDNPKKTKLMKEDLYNNLLNLMERGEILLLDDPEIFMSLRSIQFEYTGKGDLKIFGRYTHACESIIRAAWCLKDKSLNLWVK